MRTSAFLAVLGWLSITSARAQVAGQSTFIKDCKDLSPAQRVELAGELSALTAYDAASLGRVCGEYFRRHRIAHKHPIVGSVTTADGVARFDVVPDLPVRIHRRVLRLMHKGAPIGAFRSMKEFEAFWSDSLLFFDKILLDVSLLPGFTAEKVTLTISGNDDVVHQEHFNTVLDTATGHMLFVLDRRLILGSEAIPDTDEAIANVVLSVPTLKAPLAVRITFAGTGIRDAVREYAEWFSATHPPVPAELHSAVQAWCAAMYGKVLAEDLKAARLY